MEKCRKAMCKYYNEYEAGMCGCERSGIRMDKSMIEKVECNFVSEPPKWALIKANNDVDKLLTTFYKYCDGRYCGTCKRNTEEYINGAKILTCFANYLKEGIND